MGQRQTNGKLFLFNFFLAFPAFVLYLVGFASHFWLESKFEIPPQPPNSFKSTPVEANMGLYTACKRIHYSTVGGGERITENCSSDGAADWQFIAVGLAIVGMVLSFLGLFIAVLYVFCCQKTCCKIIIALCNALSAGLMTAPLLMYAINRKFQVNKTLPYIFDFNLSWGYFVSATSASLLAIVALLNIVEIVWSKEEFDYYDEDEVYINSTENGPSKR
ncbi:hypothetical protein Bpfe_010696 [Biomphalaria pfeifferi]|uniref:Uncharacterized protein n=1 Tax=Biomphalaria pfeifferi TaxID=112525 RepID=A0AAD8FCF0_BIOPF|nr:hypothetical protein Bpfe_010696 [Biomphalaria pfeifferi]